MIGEVAGGRDRPDAAKVVSQSAVDRGEPVGALEPPVPEELGIERGDDDLAPLVALAGGDLRKELREMIGVAAGAIDRGFPVVGLLGAEIHVAAGHPPELEAAGPAHLVELEVHPVAGIALEPAPHLHRRPRVPHQRGDAIRRPGVRHLIGGVGRAVCDAVGPLARAVHGRVPAGIAVDAERTPGGREVRVHEEVAEPGVAQVLLDPPTDAGAGGGTPWFPRPPRAIGALRKPDSLGHPAEEPAVLGPVDGELQADALVAGEEREEAVRGGGGDELEPSRALERAEGRDDVAPDLVEAPTEPPQALAPEVHQRQQVPLAGGGERGGRLVASEEALGEERLHLRDERRACQLVGEHRRDADGDRGGDSVGLEPAELFDQGDVGVERGLAEPVAAVGPAAVVQDVGQMTVQRENEVHRGVAYPIAAWAMARR